MSIEMPCRKPVPNLRFCCFQSIVKNFKIFEASLNILPCDLLVDFYEQRKKLNFDVRPLPLIFINQQTRHLEKLEEFGRTEIGRPDNFRFHVLQRIFSTKITHLDLTSSKLTPANLAFLVNFIPQIKKLILIKTTCNESVLEAIGNHCTDILLLDLKFCEKVDDSGIEALCTINSTSRNKKIKILNLLNTSVTAKGSAIALRNLRQLTQLLSFVDIQKLCEEFTDVDRDFINICVPFEIQTEADLETASKLFPNARHLVARLKDNIWLNSKKVIKANPNIKKIEFLQVWGDHQPNACDLMDQNFGRDLTDLLIQWCRFADIFTLCRYFPRLRHFIILGLVEDLGVGATNFDALHGFRNFRNLTLLYIDFCLIDISRYYFEKLLASCQRLKELGIRNCKDLTDGVVKRVVEVNPLSRLQKLFIFGCGVITVESLLALMTKSCSLSKIGIFSCAKIGDSDILIVKNKAIECNFDLSVCTNVNKWNLGNTIYI